MILLTMVLFYDGPFSQWYPCLFVENDIIYNCAEQYMMAQKALFFDDYQSYKKIMNSKIPAEQKKIGREIKNFNELEWDQVKERIVYNGNMLKFTSDLFLKKKLLKTGNDIIAEASPVDPIWGIGLNCNDPKVLNQKNWPGKNLLGKVLMKVRDVLA